MDISGYDKNQSEVSTDERLDELLLWANIDSLYGNLEDKLGIYYQPIVVLD